VKAPAPVSKRSPAFDVGGGLRHTGTVKAASRARRRWSARDNRGKSALRDGDRGRTGKPNNCSARPASRNSHETFVARRSGGSACVGLEGRGAVADLRFAGRTLDTRIFSVHFAEHYRSQAQVVAEVAESVYPRITAGSSGSPSPHADRVLDSLDSSNGRTPRRFPFNFIGIILSPADKASCCRTASGWSSCSHTSSPTSFTSTGAGAGGRAAADLRGYLVLPFPFTAPLFPADFRICWSQTGYRGPAVYSEAD